VAAVGFLPDGHGGDVPDGGELGGGVGAVDEVVVEGVAGALAPARPQQRLVGVGPRKLGQREASTSGPYCRAERSARHSM
jgi:hypothetical protein